MVLTVQSAMVNTEGTSYGTGMERDAKPMGMTDWQFKTILEMVNMILDGCENLDEAKGKLDKLIVSQTVKSERPPEEDR